MITPLSAVGLAVAALMAVVNVFMEVARKKAVSGSMLLPASFWCHVFDLLVFTFAWIIYRAQGYPFYIRPGGEAFGIPGLHLSPVQIFVAYEIIDFALHGFGTWMFFKALQEAAMSTAVPFLAFSSVLVLPAGFLLLNELPGFVQLLGVGLTTLGSVMMHWRLFAVGWTEPFKAIYKNKGCRYMIYASLTLAVISPLDKKLSLMADLYTQCVIFGVGMCLFFWVMAKARGDLLMPAIRSHLTWIMAAGILDAGTILLQFVSYQFIDAVIVISIKRAGIILAVVFGWLFFGERNIKDKLMAASLMFVGVSFLYLSFTPAQALCIAFSALLLAAVYIALASRQPLAPAFDEA